MFSLFTVGNIFLFVAANINKDGFEDNDYAKWLKFILKKLSSFLVFFNYSYW